MARNYLQALAKAASKALSPLGSPIEFFLSLNQDKQTQKQKDELYATILEGQNLTRETLEEILKARSEIKELREQFILGMEIGFSILPKNTALISSSDLEESLPGLIEAYKEKLEASGLITYEVLADELYKYYEKDTLLFLADISPYFPVGEVHSCASLPVIISDFLTRCSGKELKQQAKIFNALSKKNPGSEPLKVKSLMLQEQVINQIGE